MVKLPKNNSVFGYLVLHHTGGTDADPFADSSHHTASVIEQWHLQKGWEGIGYHYVIEKDGTIWAGRPEHRSSAAVLNWNSKTLNIVMAGNFDRKEGTPNRLPTKEQEESFKWLYQQISKRYTQLIPDKVIPHRKLQVKTCYGKNLADDYGKKLAQSAITNNVELADNTKEALQLEKDLGLCKQELVMTKGKFASIIEIFFGNGKV